MRTYEIYDARGVRVGVQEHDDSIAPALLQGHVAKLVAINGEQLARKSQVVLSPDAPLPPDDELETGAQARRAAEAEQPAAAPQPAPAPEVHTEVPTPDTPA